MPLFGAPDVQNLRKCRKAGPNSVPMWLQYTTAETMGVNRILVALIITLAFFLSLVSSERSESVQDVSGITDVHLIFMNHFDAGFTDFCDNVIKTYQLTYFPKAIESAEFLSTITDDKLVWTTQSWLLSLLFNDDSIEPDLKMRVKKAVQENIINYHAFPMNAEPELMDKSLFLSSLDLTKRLSLATGKKEIVILMSQKDVPGMTRAVIPLLRSKGIEAIYVGVNKASSPPDVPPVFVWRDPVSGEDIVVMYHPGGYGGQLIVPGLSAALDCSVRGDNMGPPLGHEVVEAYATVRAKYRPGTRVFASSMSNFTTYLLGVKDKLPVIESEIGDTWIHGVASDPLKLAQFRQLSRTRALWLEKGLVSAEELHGFDEKLIKIAEHTWGVDVKKFLHDFANWTNEELAFNLESGSVNFLDLEWAWKGQREWIGRALDQLGPSSSFRTALDQELSILGDHSIPLLRGFTRVDPSSDFSNTILSSFRFGRSAEIVHAKVAQTGYVLANPTHPLAKLMYETFNEADFKRFLRQYMNTGNVQWWMERDFGKVGLPDWLESNRVSPSLEALYRRSSATNDTFLALVKFPSVFVEKYGAPKAVYLEYVFPAHPAPERGGSGWGVISSQEAFTVKLKMISKTRTRLPESFWFSFSPLVANANTTAFVDKLSLPVSPMDVVRNGSRGLHGFERGVGFFADGSDNSMNICIESLDAGIVAPGEPKLTNYDNMIPNMDGGWHFNLYNNVWGTNYIMWYPFSPEDKAMTYRFTVSLEDVRMEGR